MIIDLDQDIQVFNQDIGLNSIELINVKDKTVTLADGRVFNWNEIMFTHKI